MGFPSFNGIFTCGFSSEPLQRDCLGRLDCISITCTGLILGRRRVRNNVSTDNEGPTTKTSKAHKEKTNYWCWYSFIRVPESHSDILLRLRDLGVTVACLEGSQLKNPCPEESITVLSDY